MMNPQSVTLILPQHNHSSLTIQAVQTLRETDPVRWPVLIVDNGSSASAMRALHQIADETTEIVSLPRAGLTAAWNAASRRCQSDYLVFLNNDTQSSGAWVNSLLSPLIADRSLITGVEDRRETQLAPPVDLLAGWCLAVRRSTLLEVGGFDESLQLYFSDTDLQLRIGKLPLKQNQQHWEVVPHLPLIHRRHQTAHHLHDRRERWSADRIRFLARWRGNS